MEFVLLFSVVQLLFLLLSHYKINTYIDIYIFFILLLLFWRGFGGRGGKCHCHQKYLKCFEYFMMAEQAGRQALATIMAGKLKTMARNKKQETNDNILYPLLQGWRRMGILGSETKYSLE